MQADPVFDFGPGIRRSLVGGLLFVVPGAVLAVSPGAPPFVRLVGLLTAGFFGTVVAVGLVGLAQREPPWGLTEQGIVMNGFRGARSLVTWDNIADVGQRRVFGLSVIAVVAHDPARIRERRDPRGMWLNRRLGFGDMTIPASFSNATDDELESAIRRRAAIPPSVRQPSPAGKPLFVPLLVSSDALRMVSSAARRLPALHLLTALLLAAGAWEVRQERSRGWSMVLLGEAGVLALILAYPHTAVWVRVAAMWQPLMVSFVVVTYRAQSTRGNSPHRDGS